MRDSRRRTKSSNCKLQKTIRVRSLNRSKLSKSFKNRSRSSWKRWMLNVLKPRLNTRNTKLKSVSNKLRLKKCKLSWKS